MGTVRGFCQTDLDRSFSFTLAAVEIIITLAKTLASFVSAWQNLRQAVRFETVIAFIAPGFIAFKAVADI